MKHHIMAISAIFLTIFVVFKFTEKPQQAVVPQAVPIGTRFIIIVSGTWGLNCNNAIEGANRHAAETAEVQKQRNKDYVVPDPIPTVKENNVLLELTNLCGSKLKCEFKASNEVLGNPFKSCLKEYDISYRCFEFDKLHRISGRERSTVTIDCSEEAQPKPESEPADAGNAS